MATPRNSRQNDDHEIEVEVPKLDNGPKVNDLGIFQPAIYEVPGEYSDYKTIREDR